MAHRLDQTTGKAAYFGREAGWHGLGQVVNAPVSDPKVLELAGLDWSVAGVPMYAASGVTIDSHKAVQRSDTGAILGVVGEGYALLQNAEMLDFFRNVAGARDMTVETAGAIDDGRTVWALARIPDLSLSIGQDVSHGYMLITTGHVGNRMLRIMPTLIRVVCANTLGAAISTHTGGAGKFRRAHRGSREGGYVIRHTAGMRDAIVDIASAYKAGMEDFDATREAIAALAAKLSTAESLPSIMAAAWPITTEGDEGERAKLIREEREARIARIRASETCNVDGTAGTMWADFNAVTEYIDHDSNKDAAKRFAYAQFGAGTEAKNRALDAALALV